MTRVAGSSLSGAEWASPGQALDGPQTDLYVDALRAAISLLRADGGEIATYDSAQERFVTQSRQTRPQLDRARGMPAPASRPRRDSLAGPDDVDSQPTQVLPTSYATHSYRMGEGLIG